MMIVYGQLQQRMRKLFSRQFVNYLSLFLFICLISYLLAGISYKAIALYLIAKAPEATSSLSKVVHPGEKRDFATWGKIIVEKNLFGAAKLPLPSSGQVPSFGQEESSSRWELKGTVVLNSFIGYAILAEKSKGTQQLISTGKKIENTTLIKVGRDYCVLDEGGRQYTLRSAQAKLSPLIPGEKAGGEGIVIPRQDVMVHISNLGQLLSEARIVPYILDGSPAGFQLVQIMPGSLFQRMGLSVGDVVQEVNDRKIKGADDISQLLQALQGSNFMSITVLRGGKTEKLNYKFI